LPDGSAEASNGGAPTEADAVHSAGTGSEGVPPMPKENLVFAAAGVVAAAVPLEDAPSPLPLLAATSDPRSSFFSSLDAEVVAPMANPADKFLAVPKLNPLPAVSSPRPRFSLAGVSAGVAVGKGDKAAAPEVLE